MLFRVVGSCWAKFETVKLLSQQLPTFFSEASCNNVGSVSTTPPTLLGPLTRITHVYKVFWVVFFPRCTAGPNIVWSSCIRFLTTANTDATTLNIVGPTIDDDFCQSNLVKTKMKILSATVFIKSWLLF